MAAVNMTVESVIPGITVDETELLSIEEDCLTARNSLVDNDLRSQIDDLKEKLLAYEAETRTLTRENAVLKSEKNRVGLSFRRVPESGPQTTALWDERFPCLEHVPGLSYTLSDRCTDDVETGREPSQPTDARTTLIEADNLAGLSALQLTHQEKVDLIYIDPPYNTGNKDFIYNDSFISDDDGFKHSKWLSFMHSRLTLAKSLLSDEGAIFVSIDDNEQAALKLLMDEVFGVRNFVANLAVSYNPHGRSITKFFADNHEYILVYTKNIQKTKLEPKVRSLVDETQYPYEDEHGRYREGAILNTSKRFTPENRPNLYYPYYVDPDSLTVSVERTSDSEIAVHPAFSDGTPGVWRWGKEKSVAENHKLRGKRRPDGSMFVMRKDYLTADKRIALKTHLDYKLLGSNHAANRQISGILGSGSFDYPKHVDTVKLIGMMMDKKDATILDFFAGSGTTGHAIAELNKEDGGTRHCILITHGDESGKNIAQDVTALRLKRVLSGKDWNDGKEHDPLPGELTYYRLDFAPPFESELELTGELQGRFAGHVALEQDVTLAPVQPDLEGIALLTSSSKNVLVLEDLFLVGEPETEEALAALRDPEKQNLLYLPVEDTGDYYPDSGWVACSYPAGYLRSHLSLVTLMKNSRTLVQPIQENEAEEN